MSHVQKSYYVIRTTYYVILSRSTSSYLMSAILICYNMGMEITKTPQAPGTDLLQARPPCTGDSTSTPGVSEHLALRRTVVQRRSINPKIESVESEGVAATHAYVRRYWIPIIGPGAVADLLRLTAAAQSGRSLPEPIHLPALLRSGLARRERDVVIVPTTVRPLDRALVRRLPPWLRRTHPSRIPA